MIQNNISSSDQIWIQRIEKMAEDIANQQGCFLYDLEFASGRVLRVFIDKEQGAGIEDCSNVSKAMNEFLDSDDLVPGGNYSLEVSTPGIDRTLKKAWHFEKVIGKNIWIKTQNAFETFGITHPMHLKAKQVEAQLTAFSDGVLTLETSQTELKIPLAEIEKAKVLFEMAAKGQQKNPNKGEKNKNAKKHDFNKKDFKNKNQND